MSVSSNWFNGGLRDIFVARDTVRFDSTGAAKPAVTLVSSLPVSGVVVDAASNYSFSGSGSISGSGGLTKTNSGTLTIQTVNDYTGPTVIGGGTLEATTIDLAGNPSSLGASGSSPTNLVFFGSTLRYLGAMSSTDRGATLNGSGVTLDVPDSSGTLVMTGPLVGGGGLIKNWPGHLDPQRQQQLRRGHDHQQWHAPTRHGHGQPIRRRLRPGHAQRRQSGHARHPGQRNRRLEPDRTRPMPPAASPWMAVAASPAR